MQKWTYACFFQSSFTFGRIDGFYQHYPDLSATVVQYPLVNISSVMKYCNPELSFFIFTSYERSECFIFGVKRKMLHNEVASSEKASFLWSTPVGVWSILRHCRKIWSTADAVWSKAFSGFMFFLPWNQGKKNGGRRGIRTLGELPLGGFQDRCLKPLDHSSASYLN